MSITDLCYRPSVTVITRAVRYSTRLHWKLREVAHPAGWGTCLIVLHFPYYHLQVFVFFLIFWHFFKHNTIILKFSLLVEKIAEIEKKHTFYNNGPSLKTYYCAVSHGERAQWCVLHFIATLRPYKIHVMGT